MPTTHEPLSDGPSEGRIFTDGAFRHHDGWGAWGCVIEYHAMPYDQQTRLSGLIQGGDSLLVELLAVAAGVEYTAAQGFRRIVIYYDRQDLPRIVDARPPRLPNAAVYATACRIQAVTPALEFVWQWYRRGTLAGHRLAHRLANQTLRAKT